MFYVYSSFNGYSYLLSITFNITFLVIITYYIMRAFIVNLKVKTYQLHANNALLLLTFKSPTYLLTYPSMPRDFLILSIILHDIHLSASLIMKICIWKMHCYLYFALILIFTCVTRVKLWRHDDIHIPNVSRYVVKSVTHDSWNKITLLHCL